MTEIKTEVMKLGQNMSQEERDELNKVIEHVKEAPVADKEVDAPQEEQEKPPCAQCGYTEGKPKPPQEDIEEYMRSTLGARRFSKTYEIMRGNLKVTFTTVSTAASEKMNNIITQLTAVDDPVVFRSLLTKLQLVYFLKEYHIGGEKVSFEIPEMDTTDQLAEVFVERFGEMDESVATMLTRAMNSFVALKTALVESCFDEAFYKGAGPF